MDGTPPLKRKRTEEGLLTPDPSPLRPSQTYTPPPPATRSTKFYFDDGDCVLRVEGVLFKVHRFLLTRDSVVFRDMFSGVRFQDKVPPNMNVNVCDEGIDDQRPIILPGDNSKAFEELLSVIYALPEEITKFTIQRRAHGEILSVLELTHKYQFVALELWALGVALTQFTRFWLFGIGNISGENLRRFLAVAVRSRDNALLVKVVAHWTEALGRFEDYAFLAMDAGDVLDVPTLKGPAYYKILQAYWRTIPTEKRLTKAQRIRLSVGFTSLAALWDQLRTAPPLCCHPPDAVDIHPGCNERWNAKWLLSREERAAMPESVSDVIGNIEFMLKRMHNVSYQFSDGTCYEAVRTALKKLRNDTIGKLSDHFKDPID